MKPEIRQEPAHGGRLDSARLAGAGALDLFSAVGRPLRPVVALARKTAALRPRFGQGVAADRRIDEDADAPWFWRSFVVLVLVPVAASFVYFHILASDQFVSEMRFAVRGTTESLPGSDALAASGIGMLAALNVNQDAFILADYIKSQKIIDDLSKEIDLRAIFSRPGADFLARFDPSQSPEDFLRFWRKAVDPVVEIASGIVTVRVRTFVREDSVRLAAAIRARCDAVINDLLDRMRGDMIARGEAEVKVAMDRLAVKRASLEGFRNTRMSIDPLASAHSLGDTITDLRRDLVGVEVNLASARDSLGADALRIKMLESDRGLLSSQIAALEAKVTGTGANAATAAAALADYDRLDVEKDLAEKRVQLAERLLDNARTDGNRRHIYLVSIEDPTTPESSLFPRRGGEILSILIAALTIWSVIALTVSGVRDHAR